MGFMNLDELAQILRVSIRHLQDLRKTESFPSPATSEGAGIVYRKSDIMKFIEKGGVA